MKKAKAKLYMIAPNDEFLMECFVIKTAQGKLIVVDGGAAGVGIRERASYMPSLLRAVLGLGENDYFEVDTWILSHEHGDHFYELAKILKGYEKDTNYKINRILFNFPNDVKRYADNEIDVLLDGFRHYAEVTEQGTDYYEKINGAIVNSETIERGLTIDVDDVRIEFLQTYDLKDGTDANEHCLVFRAWINGKSVLFLNDLGLNAGKRLLARYGDKLKSDVCQMAHHGQDGVEKDVYDAIKAKKRLWTTPIWVWNNTKDFLIGQVRSWVNGGKDFEKKRKSDVVACLYTKYPKDCASLEEWMQIIDEMQIKI